MVKIVPWESGTGSITLTYAGQGDGPILIESDPNNLNVSRSKILHVTTGSLQVDITINQQANQGPQPTDYVDLGLPSGLLWAKGNIVKNAQGYYLMGNPTDYGCYFSWGNIEGHNNGDGYSFDTTNYNSTSGSQLATDIASNDAQHNAAFAHLGSPWRIPTNTEFQELIDNTDLQRTTIDGVYGYKFMKKSDHSVFIFLPASGLVNKTTVGQFNSRGYYSASSLYSATNTYYLFCAASRVTVEYNDRIYGYTIRPIRPPLI